MVGVELVEERREVGERRGAQPRALLSGTGPPNWPRKSKASATCFFFSDADQLRRCAIRSATRGTASFAASELMYARRTRSERKSFTERQYSPTA